MSDTDTGMTPEPDWLAAEPTARAKLTAIMDAVRAHYTVSVPPSDPARQRITPAMAELFIGQLLLKAEAEERERVLRRIAAECHRRKWASAPDPDSEAEDPTFNALHYLGNEVLSGKILEAGDD